MTFIVSNIVSNAWYEDWAPVVARLLLAIQFSLGAVFKVMMFSMQVGATAAVGVPFPTIAVGAAFVLEVAGVFALLTGWQIRFMSAWLAAYVSLLAVLFYHNWSDPMNMGMFFSHFGLAAALLYISVFGARRFTIWQ
jgi:putative oxidoreductase